MREVTRETLEEKRETLEKKIGEHKGDLVLVICSEQEITGCTGFGHPGFVGLGTSTSLGRLNKNFPNVVDFENGTIQVPTSKYVMKREGEYAPREEKWDIVEGQIEVPFYFLPYLDEELSLKEKLSFGERFSGHIEDLKKSLQVLVGEDVELYFRAGPLHFDLAKRNKEFREQTANILSPDYAKALLLLGEEPPEDCKKAYEREELGLRVGIVNRLLDLTRQREKLEKEIARIYDSTKSGVYSEGGAIAVCEDEDDAKIISWGRRERLWENEADVKGLLRKAMELGMHTTDLRLKLQERIEIDVPKYIQGLCQFYEFFPKPNSSK